MGEVVKFVSGRRSSTPHRSPRTRSARVRRLRARFEVETDPKVRASIEAQLAAFDRTFVRST
jgi:hypothetical protein